ncbi:MAG TPA: hypothetical protein PLH88_04705 [Spirochaetota bacterium]|nr:hypothetical protein [Spirochaetota bacterium]
MKKIALALSFIFILSLELFAGEQIPEDFTPQKLSTFIAYLIDNGEYARAKTELDRLQSYYPNWLTSEKYSVTFFYLSYRAGNYRDILLYNWASDSNSQRLYVIDSYLKSNNPYAASKLLPSTLGDEFFAEAFRRRKIYIDIVENFYKGESNIGTEDESKRELYSFASKIILEKKSPAFGAAMGIIPGMGYFYAGQSGTGIVALTIIGLGSAITVGAHQNGLEPLALLSGLATFFFYGGSIYGGYRETVKYNDSLQQRLLFNIEKELSLERDLDDVYINFGIKSNVR